VLNPPLPQRVGAQGEGYIAGLRRLIDRDEAAY
jgi:hypothetical protein